VFVFVVFLWLTIDLFLTHCQLHHWITGEILHCSELLFASGKALLN
jgi:hypothetical protein